MGSSIWGAGDLMQWWTPPEFLQDTAQATRLSLDGNQVEGVAWFPNVFGVTGWGSIKYIYIQHKPFKS